MAGLGAGVGGLVDGFVAGTRLQDESRLNDLKVRAGGLELADLQRKQDLEQREQSRSDAAESYFGNLIKNDPNPDMSTAAKHAKATAIWAAQQGDTIGFDKFHPLAVALRKESREQGLYKAKQAFMLTGDPNGFVPVYNNDVDDGITISPFSRGDKAGEYKVDIQFPGREKPETHVLDRDGLVKFVESMDDPKLVAERETNHIKSLARLNEILLGKQLDAGLIDRRIEGDKTVEEIKAQNRRDEEERKQKSPEVVARTDYYTGRAGLARKQTEAVGQPKPGEGDKVLKDALGLWGKTMGTDSLDGLQTDQRDAYNRGVALLGQYRQQHPNETNPAVMHDAVASQIKKEGTLGGGAASDVRTRAARAPTVDTSIFVRPQ